MLKRIKMKLKRVKMMLKRVKMMLKKAKIDLQQGCWVGLVWRLGWEWGERV